MALLALPPPKAKPFSFSGLHLLPNIKPGKTPFPTTMHKHQKLGYHASNITQSCLNYGFKRKIGNGTMEMPIANAVTPDCEKDPNRGRILPIDMAGINRRKKAFWGRKWNLWDVTSFGLVVAFHFLCLFAPFTFSWGAFWVAFGLYIITGLLGITFCFHRLLSHRSFKLPRWLEYIFAYCGVLAAQRDPIWWVSTHRYHHQFCDSEKDPHSPVGGFWFSHIGWIFDNDSKIERCGKSNNARDLEKQPFYKFLESTYLIHPIGLGAILYLLGGFSYFVWGLGVRIVCVYHITWLVNSVGHTWGTQAWNTGDLSRNNWWLGVLAFGEGWHNNHHAFENSARHGLEWWQLDMTWYAITFLETIGLATDVKLPTSAQKKRMALNN